MGLTSVAVDIGCGVFFFFLVVVVVVADIGGRWLICGGCWWLWVVAIDLWVWVVVVDDDREERIYYFNM